MPAYEPNIDWLKEAVESVRAQIYQNWELCIADDASPNPEVKRVLKEFAKQDSRIKVCYRSENGHISAATNSALELAQGEFIALLDQDDLLQTHALAFVVNAIQDHPEAGLIYSDEDKIDGEVRLDAYFKSAWDPYLMRCHNMICHLGVYRTALVRELGGLREGFEGSQDWDLALRCVDSLKDHQIVHIPRVLYHWRIHRQSTAMAGSGAKPYTLAAAKRAIEEHLSRRGVSALAELIPELSMFRVKYDLPKQKPLVSIVIATRDRVDLLKNCINSIRKKTDYSNYEIIIVDNGSEDQKTLHYLREIKQSGIAVVFRDEGDFNFSRLNNLGVQHANGEYVLLLNNDIEVESQGWLSEMVALAIQPEIGCVGARLWYPDGRLQHGGVILGLGGFAAHAHRGMPRGNVGFFCRGVLSHTMSAVTAACLLVRKSIYLEVGGLDEEHLAIGYNDVDFCLKVRSRGYRNLLCAEADLIHHESASRGEDLSAEKLARFRREGETLRSRWGHILDNDAAYNPNLTDAGEDFGLAWPPRLKIKDLARFSSYNQR
jgi:GT2 family glycosyltransferase